MIPAEVIGAVAGLVFWGLAIVGYWAYCNWVTNRAIENEKVY